MSQTVTDRNFKACFPRCPLVALTRDAPMRNLSRGRQPPGCPRIGKTQGIFVRAPRERAPWSPQHHPPARPGARRIAAPRSAPSAGHPPQDGGESGSEDVLQGEGLGTGGCGKLGGHSCLSPPSCEWHGRVAFVRRISRGTTQNGGGRIGEHLAT